MNCPFVEIEPPREDGKRRLRCPVCRQLSGFTSEPLDRFHATCRGGGPDVGRELSRLIAELGIKVDCKACKELAAKMREWGVEGCREHRAEIVSEISSRIRDVSWPTIVAAAVLAPFTFRLTLIGTRLFSCP
jgi:hypothetical protein